MTLLQRRAFGALLGSLALLLGALAFQYVGGLAPCPLCIWQRWPHGIAVALGLLILLRPSRGLAVIAGLVVLVGAGIGLYHAGIEQGWWAGPTTCTAPDPGSLPPGELLDQILATPVVLCDEVAWSLWGISMAGWNAILSLVLAWLWFRAAAAE
jgi:disulfide bond formation protein DsbB